MANKLIHYNNKLNFETDKDSITDHSLVFILDSEEIYTHSEIYKGISWSVLKSIITFTVGSLECQAEEGMTWRLYILSDYFEESGSLSCMGAFSIGEDLLTYVLQNPDKNDQLMFMVGFIMDPVTYLDDVIIPNQIYTSFHP